MIETSTPVEVFCCYSHADEAWLRKLETHLNLLQRQGLISLWHDRLITPGTDWTQAIDTHLETASVILLLVSADFLASDYCYSVEMKRALVRHVANEARVVPILVHSVDWKGAPFAHLQVLPTDAKPIASWRSKDRALADVAAGIRRVIEDVPLLAASAPRAALPAIWNIPYPRNPFFLGRDDELTSVRDHLQGGQATALSQPQAISGLGGIGKTQLALEYAYRYYQNYQVVLWARAESTEALISSELGGLPLALDQAGAYLEETGMDLASYWHIYQQHRADLLQLRGGLVPDHPAPVATTWSLSFQRVEEKNPAAADLLRLCAYLAPDAIPEEILTAGASPLGPVLTPVVANTFRLNLAIEVLRSYSLIHRDPREKTLSVHRLVQTVLQDTLDETERRIWIERAMFAVNVAFPDVDHGRAWPQCERLLSNALLATRYIETNQISRPEAARLLHQTALYLQKHARYVEAEPLFQQVLQIREQLLGPEHPEVAYSLNGLANLYYEQGKYVKAEPLYQRALYIWEQQWGPEHPKVAYPLSSLADLYREQGRYGEAEPLYRRVLNIRERVQGPQHPETTQTRTRLIALLHALGQQEKAAQLEAVQSEP